MKHSRRLAGRITSLSPRNGREIVKKVSVLRLIYMGEVPEKPDFNRIGAETAM